MADLWRVGRKVPRNLYRGDEPIAMLATPELASELAEKLNRAEMPSTTEGIKELIDAFGDACFDCGEWQKDNETDVAYETVFARQQQSRRAVLNKIAEMANG